MKIVVETSPGWLGVWWAAWDGMELSEHFGDRVVVAVGDPIRGWAISERIALEAARRAIRRGRGRRARTVLELEGVEPKFRVGAVESSGAARPRTNGEAEAEAEAEAEEKKEGAE